MRSISRHCQRPPRSTPRPVQDLTTTDIFRDIGFPRARPRPSASCLNKSMSASDRIRVQQKHVCIGRRQTTAETVSRPVKARPRHTPTEALPRYRTRPRSSSKPSPSRSLRDPSHWLGLDVQHIRVRSSPLCRMLSSGSGLGVSSKSLHVQRNTEGTRPR